MDDARDLSTEQRPTSEEVAPCRSGVGGVALAVCVSSLMLFACGTGGGADNAATPAPYGRSTASASSTSGAAVADAPELAVPAWVPELVDLPQPGRVTRVGDTSIWYVADGYFDDVVAGLVEQFGEPAPVNPTRCTLAQLSWHLDRGSVMAIATQALRWNPRAAIIVVSRNNGGAEARCS